MKIAFYLANSGIEDVDLSSPEAGNPGVGGTQFLTVSLPYYLSNHNSDSIEPIIYANSTARLPESIQTYEAQDASEALHRADRDDVRFYIWTPSDTIEGREFIQNTDMYDVSVICWMHNITSTNFLHDIDSKKILLHLFSLDVSSWIYCVTAGYLIHQRSFLMASILRGINLKR
jgi:hypothetical protein